MSVVTVIIKSQLNELESFCVDVQTLNILITNLKLYQKDMDFVANYMYMNAKNKCDLFLPSDDGIVFIDMLNDVILDSQNITGVNKITPTEVKMSLYGSRSDETEYDNTFTRFTNLFEADYLIGFEAWQDNGHHLNKLDLDYDEIMKMVKETSSYGQFVFKTDPYNLEEFYINDWEDQTHLFNRAVELDLIPKNKHTGWNTYLEGIKR